MLCVVRQDACAALLQDLIVEVERGRVQGLTAAREEAAAPPPGQTHRDTAAASASSTTPPALRISGPKQLH